MLPAVAGFSVLLLILGWAVIGKAAKRDPKSSIKALCLAVERRDRETIAHYVDAQSLAESLRRCLREGIKMQESQEAGGFFDGLMNAIASELVSAGIDETITAQSVLAMLAGESPAEVIKSAFNGHADQTIDALAKGGDQEVQAYGAVGKFVVRGIASALIDDAVMQANAKEQEQKPEMVVTTRYESADRYLIIVAPTSGSGVAYGYVFRRHGFNTWKLSECRLMPLSSNSTVKPRI